MSWDEFLEGGASDLPLAATVGAFDGLHVGHHHLIDRVFANGEGRRKAVFTFSSNPKQIVRPSSFKGTLATLAQTLEGLEAKGLDLCVLIDFSGNFSKLAGKEFLSLLLEKGRLEYIAIGSNFSCGHKLDTDARDIAEFYAARGVVTEILEPLLWEGYAVSSSRIRVAIMDGRLADAELMLGRRYELDLASFGAAGRVEGGFVYRRPPEFVLPPIGEYQVTAVGAGVAAGAVLGIFQDRIELASEGGRAPTRIVFQAAYKENVEIRSE